MFSLHSEASDKTAKTHHIKLKMKISAAITAVGGYVPETILTNFDLEKMIDTTDEWIRTRTGIEERHILFLYGKCKQ